jgi:hypothetical protein
MLNKSGFNPAHSDLKTRSCDSTNLRGPAGHFLFDPSHRLPEPVDPNQITVSLPGNAFRQLQDLPLAVEFLSASWAD